MTATAAEHHSTRPAADEFAPYYGTYITRVPDGDVVHTLRGQIAHTLEYGGLSWLVERAARATWPGAPALKRALFAILVISALGVADEVFQSGVPGRDSTPLDWMADTFGAVLGQFRSFTKSRRGGAA